MNNRNDDLLWAANDKRMATPAELAEMHGFPALRPWNSADDMPRREGWVDLRGWEIPVAGAVLLLAAWGGVKIISLVIAALVMISGAM